MASWLGITGRYTKIPVAGIVAAIYILQNGFRAGRNTA
jgi:hypothetical protein